MPIPCLWTSELWNFERINFSSPQFVVICYGPTRKLICLEVRSTDQRIAPPPPPELRSEHYWESHSCRSHCDASLVELAANLCCWLLEKGKAMHRWSFARSIPLQNFPRGLLAKAAHRWVPLTRVQWGSQVLGRREAAWAGRSGGWKSCTRRSQLSEHNTI